MYKIHFILGTLCKKIPHELQTTFSIKTTRGLTFGLQTQTSGRTDEHWQTNMPALFHSGK